MPLYTGDDQELQGVRVEPSFQAGPFGLYDVIDARGVLVAADLTARQVEDVLSRMVGGIIPADTT